MAKNNQHKQDTEATREELERREKPYQDPCGRLEDIVHNLSLYDEIGIDANGKHAGAVALWQLQTLIELTEAASIDLSQLGETGLWRASWGLLDKMQQDLAEADSKANGAFVASGDDEQVIRCVHKAVREYHDQYGGRLQQVVAALRGHIEDIREEWGRTGMQEWLAGATERKQPAVEANDPETTLGDFLRECLAENLTENRLVAIKDRMQKASRGRGKRITLPDVTRPAKKGQKHYFRRLSLVEKWPEYTKALPGLPALKPEFTR